MSTVGQAAGYLVGGVVGAMVPAVGWVIGAQIGGMIGGYLDPPKGPKGKPPSSSDLAVQTATYGAFMGEGYGTYATTGNVFWVKGDQLDAVERELEGGKGGGSSAGTTYDIFGTFAVGFHHGEILGFKRLWFGSKLVYDAGSSDVGALVESNGGSIDFYTGSPSQLPDPDIQADMGAANTPAYRGLAYIKVRGWPMADYGNSLAGLQIKAEIVVSGGWAADDTVVATAIQPSSGDARTYTTARRQGDRITLTALTYTAWNYDLAAVHCQQHIYGASIFVPTAEPTIPTHHDGALESKFPLFTLQSTADIALFSKYLNGPSRIYGYDTLGNLVVDSESIPAATIPAIPQYSVIDGGDIYLADVSKKIYRIPYGVSASPAVSSTASAYNIKFFGVSPNYLYGVEYSTFSPTSCTIHKFDRALNFVSSVTQPVSGSYALIDVIADDEFYTMASNGYICHWLAGVATDTGLRYTGGHNIENRLLVISDRIAYVVSRMTAPPTLHACTLRMTSTDALLADIIEDRCLQSGLLESADIDVSEITQTVRGYRLTSVAAIRAGLEPLRAAWPFDVLPHGYQIKFSPRGKTPVATIDISELVAASGEKRLSLSREMDSQLPRRVQATFMDLAREYDQNTGPGAERLNTDAVNIQQIELPIVLTATEAAGMEQVLLYLYWLERHDVSFVLPPTYRHLEPADVVTLNGEAATYQLRLTEINDLPDGRIECKAKYNSVALYTPVAVAQEGLAAVQTLTVAGPSSLILLDVPCLADSMNTPGLLAGMGGYVAGWPGGSLYRSTDNGQSWSAIQGFATAMTAGLVINAPGAGRTDIIDATNRLSLRLHSGDLSSVTLTALLNGANWFAWGADGRWEIIAIQNVTHESDGSITGYDLLRGRFGTEQYMTTHAAMDEIILLDLAALRFVDLNSTQINSTALWRGVTAGKSLDSAEAEAQTYRAVNFKPLAPVYLKGSRHPTTNGWDFDWLRRTRIGGEWRDGMDAMLGEAAEAWDVEIWDATYTTLKRTLSGLATAAGSYSGVEQLTDFGSIQSALYLKIYQLSATVGRGYPLTASISTTMPVYNNPPTAVEYLVVAGGGSGGFSSTGNSYAGAGGGGGGVLQGSGHAVTAGVSYTVTVGAGGTGTNSSTQNGSNSVFNTLTATGGGAGGRGALTAGNGNNGGCGGGSSDGGTAGTGTGGQGYAGGTGATTWGTAGGGGGAGAVGANDAAGVTGNGGAGVSSAISGTSLNYGGGGGAGRYYNTDTGGGGTHGGGSGGTGNTGGGSRSAGTAGAANTGGGGGGAGAGNTGTAQAGGSGGSGIVIIRYPDTYGAAALTTGSPSIVVAGGYRTYTWTTSGTITF